MKNPFKFEAALMMLWPVYLIAMMFVAAVVHRLMSHS